MVIKTSWTNSMYRCSILFSPDHERDRSFGAIRDRVARFLREGNPLNRFSESPLRRRGNGAGKFFHTNQVAFLVDLDLEHDLSRLFIIGNIRSGNVIPLPSRQVQAGSAATTALLAIKCFGIN